VQGDQIRAALAASAKLIRHYWHMGLSIAVAQKQQGWGQAVTPRLAIELQTEFPEMHGFSEGNIGRMVAF
jgi:hypothetical protein